MQTWEPQRRTRTTDPSGTSRETGVSRIPLDTVDQRLNDLERRVTDVQDVLISLDDKLSRSEGNRTAG